MKIDLPDRTELDAARAEAQKANDHANRLRKQYQDGVDKTLESVTPDDITTYADLVQLTELSYGSRRGHEIIQQWIKSLGAPSAMLGDGVLFDNAENRVLGPSVVIMVPHDDSVVLADLERAVRRYVTMMRRGVDRVFTIKIMDNDLSASGIPELRVNADLTYTFLFTSYGHISERDTWQTLPEALKWLAANRWYGDPAPSGLDGLDDDRWSH